jgi:hypothetical protein
MGNKSNVINVKLNAKRTILIPFLRIMLHDWEIIIAEYYICE